MDYTYLTVHTTPDALVKLFDTQNDTVLYVDNTNEDGESARIPLPAGGEYYLDITTYANTEALDFATVIDPITQADKNHGVNRGQNTTL